MYSLLFLLLRPESELEARQLVDQTSHNRHPVHMADYYNSLLAAFTPEEIREQLVRAQLDQHLQVEATGDSRVLVHGVIR